MLQIEHGVALLLTLYHLAIAVRQVNGCLLHLAQALGVEEHLLHVAMRDVGALCIEVLIGSGNLDTALPAAAAEVVVGARIIEHATVDGEVIVVEAWIHRALCGAYPYAVLILAEYGTATSAQTEADDH